MTKEKISDVEAQAMMIAEVANALHEQNVAQMTEQMKNMMTMFKELLTSVQPPTVPTNGTKTKAPRLPCHSLTECPNCKKKHANHNKCWELEANKDSRPLYWKSMQSA